MKLPGVVTVLDGMGMGWDSVCISIHENYTGYTGFLKSLESELSDWISETQTFIINLRTDTVFKPFQLKSLTITKK